MRRRWSSRLLLVLLCVVAAAYVAADFVAQMRNPGAQIMGGTELPGRSRGAAPTITSTSGIPNAPPRKDRPPQSFSYRLRCSQRRQVFGHLLSPDVLSLLCDRRPLDAVKVLSLRAEAGDERAEAALALLGNVGSSCDAQRPSPTFSNYAAMMMKRARENGARSQTLQRLNEVLADEQTGPTADELEACRQSADQFKKSLPALLEQFASTLGRSIETLRGESEADVQIEYDRKTLVAGDADGELKLASELLQKGTADGQLEALALLRQAASTSAAAKTELAKCMLRGCPNPEPNPTGTLQLLMDAALAGDLLALTMLSGATDPQFFDAASILPASEQYAWSQFRQRLIEEGCFGASEYVSWASLPSPTPNLMAMSPVDSTAAETRAHNLVATHLDKTRAVLGCN
jgi:hypothetical protein